MTEPCVTRRARPTTSGWGASTWSGPRPHGSPDWRRRLPLVQPGWLTGGAVLPRTRSIGGILTSSDDRPRCWTPLLSPICSSSRSMHIRPRRRRLSDGRQRRVEAVGALNVVEADHRHPARHIDACLAERAEQAERELVVRREDRRRQGDPHCGRWPPASGGAGRSRNPPAASSPRDRLRVGSPHRARSARQPRTR